MVNHSLDILRSKSQINYDYATIKVTQSRIDKGLIAIPSSMSDWFPPKNETIQVHLNDSLQSQTKNYSSYASSARECRIGGVREWFNQNNIKTGDEIVIQVIDKENFIYRLIPERNFLTTTKELQRSLDHSETDQESSNHIISLAEFTHLDRSKIVFNEFFRLVNAQLDGGRRYTQRSPIRARESVPVSLRTLLKELYMGHCQICDYWFLKKDREPYFETHHLDPSKGHHPQNILVVCGNCHNQFEYADVIQEFNELHWLEKVIFNQNVHNVKHVVPTSGIDGFFKEFFT